MVGSRTGVVMSWKGFRKLESDGWEPKEEKEGKSRLSLPKLGGSVAVIFLMTSLSLGVDI